MSLRIPYFDKLLWGGEAADAERQQDPSAGVAALGRILSELFADLTVDLIPDTEQQQLNKTADFPIVPLLKKYQHITEYNTDITDITVILGGISSR